MNRILTAAALAACAAAALVSVTPTGAAADDDSNFGPGIDATANWAFSAASVCFQELAVVPVGGAWNGNIVNHCVNGNVLNHPAN